MVFVKSSFEGFLLKHFFKFFYFFLEALLIWHLCFFQGNDVFFWFFPYAHDKNQFVILTHYYLIIRNFLDDLKEFKDIICDLSNGFREDIIGKSAKEHMRFVRVKNIDQQLAFSAYKFTRITTYSAFEGHLYFIKYYTIKELSLNILMDGWWLR